MFGSQEKIIGNDLIDLHGKVAIVTGGNTGIGYGIVQFLVEKGAKVYMAARNEEKAKAAIEEIQTELRKSSKGSSEGGTVHWLRLDLADPRLAKEAANEILQKEERLDIVVNNAVGGSQTELTKDGLLSTMVVNHISPFVFTEALLPLLKTTAAQKDSDVRIVNVTSVYHAQISVDSFAGREHFTKRYGESTRDILHAYGVVKLANILHIKHLQSRLNSESVRITCLAAHPGTVNTQSTQFFFNSWNFMVKILGKMIILPLFFTTWRQGAMTPAFAAAGKQVALSRESEDETERKIYEGAYLVPVAKIAEPSKYAKDERLQRELYETTVEILDELGL
jgi:NAD(P)-dependent dehydrogenase (short-subunit alcohol dehydrogenase family)